MHFGAPKALTYKIFIAKIKKSKKYINVIIAIKISIEVKLYELICIVILIENTSKFLRIKTSFTSFNYLCLHYIMICKDNTCKIAINTNH